MIKKRLFRVLYIEAPQWARLRKRINKRTKQHKHIRTAKPKTLNERRRAVCLPSVK